MSDGENLSVYREKSSHARKDASGAPETLSFEAFGKAPFGGFAVEARKGVARFVHHLHDLVEAHHVRAVGERGVGVGVEGPGCGDGVALDAGDLHQSAHGVACEAQVVFETHLGGVFDLRRGSAEELARGGGSHGARHADLALAADLGARNGGVGLGDVAEKSGGGQRPQDADAQEVARGGEVVEHGGHDAARPARGGCHDRAARGVFLGGGQRVGVDFGPRGERVGVAFRLDPVGRGLAGDLQPSGQHAVVVQAVLDGCAHRLPDRVEVVPDFGTFAVAHILPEGLALVVAPLLDLRNGRQRVDAPGRFEARGLVGQRPAADAVNGPGIDDFVAFQPFEQHAVGVEGEHDLRFPDDPGRGGRFEHRKDRHVRQVALARGGQRSVEGHAVGVDVAAAFRKPFGGPLGTHRVAARRAAADPV